jgi:hypothetical protein
MIINRVINSHFHISVEYKYGSLLKCPRLLTLSNPFKPSALMEGEFIAFP